MKGRHISATAEDKPCRSEHTNKALRTKDNPKGLTGFRCSKVEGHRATEKDPKGGIHAAIGLTGSVHATWQDRRKA